MSIVDTLKDKFTKESEDKSLSITSDAEGTYKESSTGQMKIQSKLRKKESELQKRERLLKEKEEVLRLKEEKEKQQGLNNLASKKGFFDKITYNLKRIKRFYASNPDLVWLALTLLLVGFFFFVVARLYFGFTVKEIKTSLYEYVGVLISGVGAYFALKKKVSSEPGAYTKEIIRKKRREREEEDKKNFDPLTNMTIDIKR